MATQLKPLRAVGTSTVTAVAAACPLLRLIATGGACQVVVRNGGAAGAVVAELDAAVGSPDAMHAPEGRFVFATDMHVTFTGAGIFTAYTI